MPSTTVFIDGVPLEATTLRCDPPPDPTDASGTVSTVELTFRGPLDFIVLATDVKLKFPHNETLWVGKMRVTGCVFAPGNSSYTFTGRVFPESD